MDSCYHRTGYPLRLPRYHSIRRRGGGGELTQLITAWEGWGARFSIPLLLTWVPVESQFFPRVCQNVSALLCCSWSCGKEMVFLLELVMHVPSGVHAVPVFSIWGILGKNKTQGTHHCIVLGSHAH